MTFDEKILILENRIIDFLTMIMWWTEVRFDKDNIAVAVTFTTLSSLCFFLAIAINLPEMIERKHFIFFSFSALVAILIGAIFCRNVLFRTQLVSSIKRYNPQGTPNPCRISRRHSTLRRLAVFCFFFGLILFPPASDVSNMFMLTTFFLDCLKEFLVACDSLPPQEKMRRKIANEEASGFVGQV